MRGPGDFFGIRQSGAVLFRIADIYRDAGILNLAHQAAEKILSDWEKGLAELNRRNDGIFCEIACGFVYGEKGFSMDETLALADQRMYEDKVARKQKARQKTQNETDKE